MMRLPRPITWIKRQRTSKGFGVHSPFAFEFITRVLCDHSARYYAFPEIDALCGKTHRDSLLDNMGFSVGDYDRQEARMLFRLLCYFNPAQVVEIGGASEVSRIIIERSVPRAELHRWSRDCPAVIDHSRSCLVIVNYTIDINFTIIRQYLLEAVERHGDGLVVMFRNMALPIVKRLFRQFDAVQSYGMTFFDDLTAVYVGRRKLPRMRFEMNM